MSRRAEQIDMGFWDHVDALRGVLIRAIVVTALLCGIFFAAMPQIFDSWILAPCRPDFPLFRLIDRMSGQSAQSGITVNLVNYRLASQFFVHMSTSLWLAAVAAFPVILWLIWGFVKPALYDGERRGAAKALCAGTVLFFAGVGTGYFLVFPLTLRFLAGYQLSESIPNTISLDSYIDNFVAILLIMGITFELPVLTWLLGRTGLLNRSFFRRYRRHAAVALLVAAAVITPTGDPFTLLVVFLPLYLLWEAGGVCLPRDKRDHISENQLDTR